MPAAGRGGARAGLPVRALRRRGRARGERGSARGRARLRPREPPCGPCCPARWHAACACASAPTAPCRSRWRSRACCRCPRCIVGRGRAVSRRAGRTGGGRAGGARAGARARRARVRPARARVPRAARRRARGRPRAGRRRARAAGARRGPRRGAPAGTRAVLRDGVLELDVPSGLRLPLPQLAQVQLARPLAAGSGVSPRGERGAVAVAAVGLLLAARARRGRRAARRAGGCCSTSACTARPMPSRWPRRAPSSGATARPSTPAEPPRPCARPKRRRAAAAQSTAAAARRDARGDRVRARGARPVAGRRCACGSPWAPGRRDCASGPRVRTDRPPAPGFRLADVRGLAGADAVVAAALAQLGWPYVWGGESRAEGGFDCSGLVDYAFAAAGLPVGRLTAAGLQQLARPLPAGTGLRPGRSRVRRRAGAPRRPGRRARVWPSRRRTAVRSCTSSPSPPAAGPAPGGSCPRRPMRRQRAGASSPCRPTCPRRCAR